MRKRLIQKTLTGIAVVSGLDDRHTNFQIGGTDVCFQEWLSCFEGACQTDNETIDFRFALATNPALLFPKKLIAAKKPKIFQTLNVLAQADKTTQWEIKAHAEQVTILVGAYFFPELIAAIKRRAQIGGDFTVGPETQAAVLLKDESIRRWIYRNHIFIF